MLEAGAREREVELPRGRLDRLLDRRGGRRERRRDGRRARPARPHPGLGPRAASLVVTYPAEHVARGLGDAPERERPLEATLWGEPRCGRALARLADGTDVRWTRGEWSASGGREVTFALRR